MSNINIEADNDASLTSILFKGKSLSAWQEEFTINVSPGNTGAEMQNVIATLNNKYHLAYNCYNELLIVYSNLEKKFNVKKGIVIKALIDQWKEGGASGRTPAKEVLSEMAISNNTELKALNSQLLMVELIKTFFENNKMKLEKTMQLVINLSFMVSSSEKIHHKSGEPFLS